MVEVLEFIFKDVTTFLGTLALIGFTGISTCVALSPFGRVRNVVTYVDMGEEDADQN